MNMWIPDPKDGKPSVSLTLLVLTFLGCCVGGALQIAGKVETVSIFLEMFYGATALYFGRRLSINGKAYSSDQSDNKGT